ncbi:MAG: hypothetical protein WA117_16860 [Verrucomicrobiia bacterium]
MKCGRAPGNGLDWGRIGNGGSSSASIGSTSLGGNKSTHRDTAAEVTMKRGRGTTTDGAGAAASAGMKCGRAPSNGFDLDSGGGGGGGDNSDADMAPSETSLAVMTFCSTGE